MVQINHSKLGEVLIPSSFIDNYLADANGEFVKVYLMLLRMKDEAKSLSDIADALSCTEKDIERAIAYWVDKGVFSMQEGDSQGGISKGKCSISESGGASNESKKTVSKTLVSEDFKMLQFVAEQYLGKPLKKSDINTLLWLIDDAGFDAELIEFLIEYCASLDKKSFNYIKAVAVNWIKEGIKDVNAAKKQIEEFGKGKKTSGKNSFLNFDQRNIDLNALIGKDYEDVT